MIAGALAGICYASAQIYNGTARRQFIVGLSTLVIFLTFLAANGIGIQDSVLGLYFLLFNIFFNLTLLMYLFLRRWNVGVRNGDWPKDSLPPPPMPGELLF